jgi:hypothetical protein
MCNWIHFFLKNLTSKRDIYALFGRDLNKRAHGCREKIKQYIKGV